MNNKEFEPFLRSLKQLFESSLYKVPVYQRPYSWENEQVKTLLEDINKSYLNNCEECYYTGNIIIFDRNNKLDGRFSVYELIDGQQRITTFVLMMLALYSLCYLNNVDKTDPTLLSIKQMLWKAVDRKPSKDLPVLELNSIEKKCFNDLINCCFDAPKDLYSYAKSYERKSKFEGNIMDNYMLIFNFYNETIMNKEGTENILKFADYLIDKVKLIAIISATKENKVFSLFESINSKGKKLEEIDLIKTFIFSQLDEDSYATYLDKWGQLITKTHDQLYDYLCNYIKAFLAFYRNNISITNFKLICEKYLMNYCKKETIADALKYLIDDMRDKVEFYNMLSSTDLGYSFVKSNKFRFFYRSFVDISYQHPKSLFFRTFVEYKEGNIDKNDVIAIVIETIKFMFVFLTICNRPSKDAITMFQDIMNEIYADDGVDKDKVINRIGHELINRGITNDKIKNDIKSIDGYKENKKASIVMLSLYESIRTTGIKVNFSYDQAYLLCNTFSSNFSLDHLLVQKPDPNDDDYKYYNKNINGHEYLVLKDGNDFPQETITDGMIYEDFSHQVLNKIGNLRICYGDKNSARQNVAIQLNEISKFVSYSDITKRENDIINILVDNVFYVPKIEISKINGNNSDHYDSNLFKIKDLILNGLIKIGDKLLITGYTKKSIATLIDSKFVDYNGKKMTLNEWGCRVTGWKSINIYRSAFIEGEKETLHEKRVKQIKKSDDYLSCLGD